MTPPGIITISTRPSGAQTIESLRFDPDDQPRAYALLLEGPGPDDARWRHIYGPYVSSRDHVTHHDVNSHAFTEDVMKQLTARVLPWTEAQAILGETDRD